MVGIFPNEPRSEIHEVVTGRQYLNARLEYHGETWFPDLQKIGCDLTDTARKLAVRPLGVNRSDPSLVVRAGLEGGGKAVNEFVD